jgi:4-hydroxy-tetrahydrodipicolinate synthase
MGTRKHKAAAGGPKPAKHAAKPAGAGIAPHGGVTPAVTKSLHAYFSGDKTAAGAFHIGGAMTALVTPFAKGRVDFEALGRLIEAQVAAGIDAIVPCGTTGESTTLSHEEHKDVVRFAVKAAAGRTKVLAGTGSNSTAEAVELTRDAARAGADAALLVAPYYNKPTQEGLHRHFKAVGVEAGGFPMVLYSIPGRCGIEIAIPTLARLAKLTFVVGLKEAGGSVDRVSSIVAAAPELPVLSGDDSLTLPMMAVGARGVISVVSNLLPADVKRMVEAVRANDWETARALHYRMLPLIRLLIAENSPMGIKTAMSLAGLCSAEVRPPLCELSAETAAQIGKALADYGIRPAK